MKQDYVNLPKEVISAIEVLESYIAEKEDEINKLKTLTSRVQTYNPIIEGDGYFRIVSYIGGSEKIKEGHVYRGYTFERMDNGHARGVIRHPIKAYFSESNAVWVSATKEEYIKQQKDEKEI